MRVDPKTGARYFELGPIPKGTPVNLLANTDLEIDGLRKAGELAELLVHTVEVLKTVKSKGLTGDAATRELMRLVPDFYRLNSCPDFVEDRGHLFGTDLPDEDK